ncbi:exonuclease 1-like, partial [Paramuricea clavata]
MEFTTSGDTIIMAGGMIMMAFLLRKSLMFLHLHRVCEKILKQAEKPDISKSEANKLQSRAASMTFEDIVICLAHNVKYVVSPYETDAQIAHMPLNGHADFGITEDSDLLVYGCKKAMAKLKLSGDGEYFQLAEILGGLNLSQKQFQQMCIAAGCDYLTNVKDRLSEEFAIQNIFLNLLSKLADGYANDMAVGNIDTKSGEKVNGYSHLVK